MIYKSENGFSHTPHVPGEDYVDQGNEFISVIVANDESYSWLPLSDEARNNQTYLSALINSAIMETD